MNVLEQVAEGLKNSQRVLAFTGAGISVESGVPDFRSEGGLWDQYPIEEYATREAFLQNPEKVWDFFLALAKKLEKVEPNPAHICLARLEEKGILQGVITQNIDGLHRKGGTRNLVELHGQPHLAHCLDCRREFEISLFQLEKAPVCKECKKILKPNVVLFGDLLPTGEWEKAYQWLQYCEILLVIGTSGEVEPAASLPQVAQDYGAAIYQFDLRPNRLTQRAAYFIPGKAGENFARLAELMGLSR